jgi:hypothetical protein
MASISSPPIDHGPIGAKKLLLEYSGAVPIYIGYAAAGTDPDSASWRIKRLSYVANNLTAIEYPEGDDSFSYIWDDRVSYDYS